MNPYRAHGSVRNASARVLLAALLALTGCAPGRPAVVAPVPDAADIADALRAETRLQDPAQVVFGWRANDRGVRASGRGAARVAPPARARLDLFLDNGETALRAALVDSEIRLPPGAPDDMLPPPDLLWAALGVVHPGPDATFAGGDRLEDGSVRLRYRYPDGTELHYGVQGDVLHRVDVLRGGRIVQEVELVLASGERFPTEATYRHRTDFRELHLVRESIETVSSFPDDIWIPTR